MPEKFSASNATKFMHCHASANLDIAIPNWVAPERDPDANNAANRGTKKHKIFADLMALSLRDTEHMIEALQYVNFHRSKRRFKTLIEQTEVADWLPSAPTTTADLVLYLNDELHIFDLKTGKISVHAAGNDQMLFYAATYLKYAPNAKGVTLHIVQPWAKLSTSCLVMRDELYQWMEQAIQHDTLITDGDTTFQPGDHCQFCKANPRGRGAKGHPFCPVLMNMYYPQEPLDRTAVLEVDELDD